MKRRNFFKSVLLSAAATGVLSQTKAKVNSHRLIQVTPINGMQYHKAAEVLHKISYDDEVTLKREPDNPHDSKAIAVYWQKAKLGYIPQFTNEALARLLDQDEPITAIISNIEIKKMPYAGLDIEVYLGVS